MYKYSFMRRNIVTPELKKQTNKNIFYIVQKISTPHKHKMIIKMYVNKNNKFIQFLVYFGSQGDPPWQP